MNAPHDAPLRTIAAQANAAIAKGYVVFQKFTCRGCGARQTMDVPDTFYTSGRCEECGTVTDLEPACGFMAVGGLDPASAASLRRVLDGFSADSSN